MESSDQEQYRDAWKHISRVENDILKGNIINEKEILAFIQYLFEFTAANKVGLTWPNKYETSTHVGLHIGSIGPWPLIHRIKNLLHKSSKQWSNQLIPVYFEAFNEYLFMNYQSAQTLLTVNYPKTGLIPSWYFGLTQNSLFKTGQYSKAISLIQREIVNRKERLPGRELLNPPTKRFHMITRHIDLLFNGDMNHDINYHPGEFLGDSLRDLAEYTYVENQLKHLPGSRDLLLDAHNYHTIYSLLTSSILYKAYLTYINKNDEEIRFLLGRVWFLMNLYKEADQCFDMINRGNRFAAWGHFGKGEILFHQENYRAAEHEFNYALKQKNDELSQSLSRFHLGFIHEIRGDFQGALAWYEPELDGSFSQIAEAHIVSLRTRL